MLFGKYLEIFEMSTEQVDNRPRCKQCTHLSSFHTDADGCNIWLLGIAKVPLYRCACVCRSDGSSTIDSLTSLQQDTFLPISVTAIQPTIHVKSITATDLSTLRLELDKAVDELRKMSEELDRACKALRFKRSQEG
jgi:hypothetical protein